MVTMHAWAALLLRLALGAVFLYHGLTKLLVFTLPGTAQFFEQIGFPGWMAYPVAGLEIGGGALLVLGLGARWAAWALVPVMLGATQAHLTQASMSGGREYAVFLVVALVVQGLLGSGAYALKWPARIRSRRPSAVSHAG